MRYALYLDWENLWITHIKVCFPRLHVSELNLPRPIATHQERQLLAELPDLMMRVLRDKLSSVPRFSKAFAVWESLNYCDDLPSRLRQWNINPIQSLGKIYYKSGKRSVKESSDRALIIKVIEDVMLRPHSQPEAVVIATGDFGFVPLIEFLMEHTTIDVYILSYRACLSQPLEQMITAAFDADHVIVLDDHPDFVSLSEQCRQHWPAERADDTDMLPDMDDGDSVIVDVASDEEFLFDLTRALTRARMPYIDPGLVENRWCSMWEQHKTYSARAALLFRKAVEDAIVTIETSEFEGRQVRTVTLNRAHPALAPALRRIEDEGQSGPSGPGDPNGGDPNGGDPNGGDPNGGDPAGSDRPEGMAEDGRLVENRRRDDGSGSVLHEEFDAEAAVIPAGGAGPGGAGPGGGIAVQSRRADPDDNRGASDHPVEGSRTPQDA